MRKVLKKWRSLPIKKRLEIPRDLFGVDEKTLKKIRSISDSSKRLIEASRLQYDLFGEINSYLTTWIAGYGSDVVIRQKFGSAKALRAKFIKPVKYKGLASSWADVRRDVRIPVKMCGNLAEETGIHIGDGNLHVFISDIGRSYKYSVNGDLVNEFIYHTGFIKKLMKSLYNLDGSFAERINKNNVESNYRSKLIVEFKNKILGLPIGPKKDMRIPLAILKNSYFKKRCIVGLIDTDFNITEHLAISGKINNLYVAEDMHLILKENNIKHIYKKYVDYSRFYIPSKFALKIVNDWELHNPKHTSKFEIVKEFGKFMPFTTTPERLALLSGKLDIGAVEGVSNKRRKGVSMKTLVNYK